MLGLLFISFASSRTALVLTCLIDPFVDERFVLMIPLALAVRFIIYSSDADEPARLRWDLIIVCGLGAIYAALRIAALKHDSSSAQYIALTTGELHHSVPWTRYVLGAWMGIRALWVLLAAAIVLAFGQRGRTAGLVLALTIAMSIALNLSVAGDLSRSMGTLLPAALLGLFMLQRRFPRETSLALPALLLANLLLPASNVVTTFVEPNQRLPDAIKDYVHPPAVVNAQVYYQSGKAALDAGNPSDALQLLNWSLRLDPDSPSALIYRSIAKAKLRDFAGANADARAASKISLVRP